MKRYSILKSFNDFDKNKIFENCNSFERYVKKLNINSLKEKKNLSKLDYEMKEDIEKIDKIIETNNELDYFKNEIIKVNLLNDNKFDLSTNKRINKNLNVFGYKLKKTTKRINNRPINKYYIKRL
jgi:hypothetical protein